MKSWHGCRLPSSARGPCEPLRVPCTSVILRGCREGEPPGGRPRTMRHPSPGFRLRGRNAVGDS
jgi:hypothetical protein